MAEKASENAAALSQNISDDEVEHESEEGEGPDPISGDEGSAGPSRSPKKKVSTPRKKKVTSAGMQLPEYWPWEEAKKLFITPDVQKADDLDVSFPRTRHVDRVTDRYFSSNGRHRM